MPDVVINVVDATNLERNLFLTTQLIDMDIKVVIALNMYDEMEQTGARLDYEHLGRMLGIPIVPTVASQGTGIRRLFDTVAKVFEDKEPTVRHIHINYGTDLEEAIGILQNKIWENSDIVALYSSRYLAIKLLEGDQSSFKLLEKCANFNDITKTQALLKQKLEKRFGENPESAIADAKYGFIVAEDDPYRDLRYQGQALPPIKSYDTTGNVVYLGSFSKLVSPGLRVGYLLAHEELLRKCTIGKQGTDLHTPNLNQAIIDQFLRRDLLDSHVQSIIPGYREKLELMLEELSSFPEGTRYTAPEGGLFIFVEMPEGFDATALFSEAVERGVAYVPGTHFYPDGGHHNTLRLNFSNSTPQQIHEGMGKLRELFAAHLG